MNEGKHLNGNVEGSGDEQSTLHLMRSWRWHMIGNTTDRIDSNLLCSFKVMTFIHINIAINGSNHILS